MTPRSIDAIVTRIKDIFTPSCERKPNSPKCSSAITTNNTTTPKLSDAAHSIRSPMSYSYDSDSESLEDSMPMGKRKSPVQRRISTSDWTKIARSHNKSMADLERLERVKGLVESREAGGVGGVSGGRSVGVGSRRGSFVDEP
ncbi:hypothetical protein BP5796_06063 [Coleophoma crateriformis]|uniref:Uncharacterized protein n=1 Tax=Coleophoma crateriformis TaxID=565419 RepID=A0A3D8RWN0_9HELO|nr:hypothetical protein BP5796_06063 [Coleophoma crateriformis]